MGYAWRKKYKVLNISMVTLQGESQADHIRTKPNGDKKETSPTISTYCRTFFYVSVLPERQKRGTKRHGWVSKSYPLPQKTIRGYDCRKMAYFWRDLSILYLTHLQWLKLVLHPLKVRLWKIRALLQFLVLLSLFPLVYFFVVTS